MDPQKAKDKKELREMLEGKLRETLDVIVHHGKQVLDGDGNIDGQLVQDQEAIRHFHDKLWSDRVTAFNKVVLIKDITREEALKMKLL